MSLDYKDFLVSSIRAKLEELKAEKEMLSQNEHALRYYKYAFRLERLKTRMELVLVKKLKKAIELDDVYHIERLSYYLGDL